MLPKAFYFSCVFFISLSLLSAQPVTQTYFEWTQLPFSKEELAQRRVRLLGLLQKQGKTGLVLMPSKDGLSGGETFRQLDDFYYFTGLELPNSILVMDIAEGSAVVYVPNRDFRFENGSRLNDFPGRLLLADKAIEERSGLQLENIQSFPIFMNEKANTATTIFVNNGGQGPIAGSFEEYVTTLQPIQVLLQALQAKHPGLVYENIYGSIASLRMIKSPAEIELMRKSVDITVKGIITAARAIKAGVDERYLEGVLEGSYKMNGSQRLAFGSIIKSGPNSFWPWRILATHYNRRNRRLEKGELVIFDVGCEYYHYVSDVGRTFPVSGKFTPRQKEILEMEVAVADKIIEFIRPGITFRDIKVLTDSIIPEDAKPYMQVGLYFGHHLGLSSGDPNLPNAVLQPGMVFTVEPWYYNHKEQISVFTEDVLLVTENGCEVLSKALPRTSKGLERLIKD